MNYLLLDHQLYILSDEDMVTLNSAVGSCCGVCCPETLQELRKVFLDIKNRYKPFEIEGQHTTPYEQFDTDHPDYVGRHSFF